ncbi:MAG: M48 family metalloprotease, partial [Planctomycetota bacterium]
MTGFLICIIAIIVGFTYSGAEPESINLIWMAMFLPVSMLICFLTAFITSKQTEKSLLAKGREAAVETFIRMRRFVWVTGILCYALMIHGLYYNYIVSSERYLNLGGIPVISEIIILAPFFLFAVSALAGLRKGENLLRMTTWRTVAFITFHLRQYLLPIIPFLMFSGIGDIVSFFPRVEEFGAVYGFVTLIGIAVVVLVFMLLAPLVLRFIWKTEPLKAGALRDSLEKILRDSGTGVHDILIWNTGGGFSNALMTGLIKPFRYVFLTDGLLNNLTQREIEAVFAHEIGHAKHKHLLIYLLLII